MVTCPKCGSSSLSREFICTSYKYECDDCGRIFDSEPTPFMIEWEEAAKELRDQEEEDDI